MVHRRISAQEMGKMQHDVNNRLKGKFADFTHAAEVQLFAGGVGSQPVKTAV